MNKQKRALKTENDDHRITLPMASLSNSSVTMVTENLQHLEVFS